MSKESNKLILYIYLRFTQFLPLDVIKIILNYSTYCRQKDISNLLHKKFRQSRHKYSLKWNFQFITFKTSKKVIYSYLITSLNQKQFYYKESFTFQPFCYLSKCTGYTDEDDSNFNGTDCHDFECYARDPIGLANYTVVIY